MKSRLVMNAEYIPQEDKKNYSDLKVLKSVVGYYIGTMYTNTEGGFQEPGSRDSYSYWQDVEQVEYALHRIHENKDLYDVYLKESIDD